MKGRTRPQPIIALLTDFGLWDSYVGVMKGVILGIAPAVRVVDISHEIAPGDIPSAAFLLERSCDYFPRGTVFLTVVDPGVGSGRRALAIRTGGWYFVGPDNGVFSHVLDRSNRQGVPSRVVSLTRPKYWLPKVSCTFHGRDIFAPVAAHLASGVRLPTMGEPVIDPVTFAPPACRREKDRVIGEVVYVDRFGNLVTSIPAEEVEPFLRVGATAHVEVRGKRAGTLGAAYASVAAGTPLAVIGGFDRLEVSVNGGSAANRFGAGPGDQVVVRLPGLPLVRKAKKTEKK